MQVLGVMRDTYVLFRGLTGDSMKVKMDTRRSPRD